MIRQAARSIAIIFIILLAASTIAAQQVPRVAGPAYAPGEIVVGFEPSVSVQTMRTLTVLHGAVTVRQFPQIGARQMKLPSGRGVGAACAELAKLKGIRYAEPNYSR